MLFFLVGTSNAPHHQGEGVSTQFPFISRRDIPPHNVVLARVTAPKRASTGGCALSPDGSLVRPGDFLPPGWHTVADKIAGRTSTSSGRSARQAWSAAVSLTTSPARSWGYKAARPCGVGRPYTSRSSDPPEDGRILGLGASMLTGRPVVEDGWRWHILADADGNEFCVLQPPDAAAVP
jgi:hypothetical protein